MTRARRVAFVTTSYPTSPDDAAGHFVATEARAAALAGDRVWVIAPGRARELRPGNPEVRSVPAGDLFGFPGALPRLRERPVRALHAARFVLGARRALRDLAPLDLVVAHWLLPSACPIALAAPASTPIEAVAHGSDVRLLLTLPPLLRCAMLRSLLARPARIRFVSHELRDTLAAATRDDELRSRSRVEASPIDVSGVPDRSEARRRLRIPADDHLIVIVSRLVATKRVDAALRSARRLAAGRLVVVGDGPLRERLVRAFPDVHFTGHLPRPRALLWIAAADLLVSASRQEGAPTAIREARALGVPVLAAPCGDVRRWSREDPGITVLDAP